MKKVLKIGLSLVLMFGVFNSCEEDSDLVQTSEEELALIEFEKIRKKLATDMATFVNDSKIIISENSTKSEDSGTTSFEDFTNSLPNGNNLTEEGEAIALSAFELHIQGIPDSEIIENYSAEQILALLKPMEEFEDDADFEIVWNQIMFDLNIEDDTQEKGIFGAIWKGIKKERQNC